MPICNQCGIFHPSTKRKSSLCLPCKRSYDKAWRANRKASGNRVISAKLSAEYHAAYQAEYKLRPGVREHRAEVMKSYSKRIEVIPKNRARRLVRSAVSKGSLVPCGCIQCDSKAEAHHPDYSKPLDVVWLCRKHHRELHAKAEGR